MTEGATNSLDTEAERIFQAQTSAAVRNTDRIFRWLLPLEWLFGVIVAFWVSPRSWAGMESGTHPHVWAAVLLGGAIISLPVFLAWRQPGKTLTRHTVAAGQMLIGSLLIHLTGGRIETHFHIFGSLAFLAFYRDWHVLITATGLVLADHITRGIAWPQSIYGVESAPLWRTLEHAGWVLFENIFLLLSIRQSLREMHRVARHQAELAAANAGVEAKVQQRTAELGVSEEKFRLMGSSAPVGIFQTNAAGECTFTNERWRSITRLPQNESPERMAARLLPEDRAKVLAGWRGVMESGIPLDCECRLPLPGGEIRWLHMRANAFLTDGGITGAVGTIEDITPARETERELALARDEALESARLKSEFLANMSHEIRTPMNAVIGMSSLVLDSELNPWQREFITIVNNSAESLLTILNDILDFSKIESGKLSFEEEDFNLRDTVEDTLELLAESAQTKGLELVGLLQPGSPVQVRGDAGRLRQVLLNLLGNAVKFTERGEVVARVSQVSQDENGVKLRFEVQDTGIGIAPEAEPRLFEAFTQADGSTTRKFGGTGLGLAISKRIVEMMGGEIGVQSEQGRGSLFWFTAVFKTSITPVALTPQARLDSPAGMTALIVDDNITNILLLHHQLAAWGMKSRYASGAAEAMRILEEETAAGRSFQIAILDMQMPGKDGLELGRDIKANPAYKNLPLIMLTSLGVRLESAMLREAGIAECLLKPVRQLRLFECLLRVLQPTTPAPALTNGLRAETMEDETLNPGLRILVAEDNTVNQKVALFQLRKLGWNARVASNGYEVLAALERSPYDIIFMDCQMPEMEGYEASRRIRAKEKAAGIPENGRVHIIALTANAMAGDREKCLAAGMNDYLSKPLKLTNMAEAIKRYTDNRPVRILTEAAPAL